ncbi:MAG: signal peptide peptidase SppA [Nanobdellota archaeon]
MFIITKSKNNKSGNKVVWIFVGLLLAGLFVLIFLGFMSAIFFAGSHSGDVNLGSGNVAVIDVSGIIRAESSNSFMSQEATADKIKKYVNKAAEDKSVEAILFRINSGGGSPVATDEIASAIKKANKTTVAVIRETGASGAYWIASACDVVFANEMSIVGSIGVTSATIGFGEFLQEHNITYRKLVSGKYKDIGTPLREMTPHEKSLFKKRLEVIHDIFVKAVAENRNLSEESVEKLATGLFWTGLRAKELGLVDKFGGVEQAIEYIEEKNDINAKKVKYTTQPSFLDLMLGVVQKHGFNMGQGIGSALIDSSHESQIKLLV